LQQDDSLKPSACLIETAIENNIKKLREKGIISCVGSDKTGSWEILKKENK
jgi:predicted HTH transcriptional regulator